MWCLLGARRNRFEQKWNILHWTMPETENRGSQKSHTKSSKGLCSPSYTFVAWPRDYVPLTSLCPSSHLVARSFAENFLELAMLCLLLSCLLCSLPTQSYNVANWIRGGSEGGREWGLVSDSTCFIFPPCGVDFTLECQGWNEYMHEGMMEECKTL